MKDSIFLKILEKERLPDCGLCYSVKNNKRILNLFHPDIVLHRYWAYGEEKNLAWDDMMYKITPLRQTILMLCNEIYKDEQLKKKKYDKKRKK